MSLPFRRLVRRILPVLAGLAGTSAGVMAQQAALPATLPASGLVVTSQRAAAEAGAAMLREGGTAADAAVAATLALMVVSPQLTGLGADAMALSYRSGNGSGVTTLWDGRSTTPAAAGSELFLDRSGQALPDQALSSGGRMVGAPGALRLLEALQHEDGKLPWARVVAPAIALAQNGFAVSHSLATALAAGHTAPAPREAAMLTNRPLAQTLAQIATSGADVVLRGPVAAELARLVRNDRNPGLLTADDLASTTPQRRPPFCRPYHATTVCTAGPPSSGGFDLQAILALMDLTALPRLDPAGAETAHALAIAARNAERLRDRFLGDPDQMPVAVEDLLSQAALAALTRPAKAPHAADALAALPGFAPLPAAVPAPLEADNAVVLVVDGSGNAISLSTSLQSLFGSRLALHGVVLGDALQGFARQANLGGAPVVNHIASGRRPRSALVPAMLFDAQGHLRAVLGVEGGAGGGLRLAQLAVRLIDQRLSPRAALTAPFFRLDAETVVLDDGVGAHLQADLLRARGEKVTIQPPSARVMLLSVSDSFRLASSTQAAGAVIRAP